MSFTVETVTKSFLILYVLGLVGLGLAFAGRQAMKK